jgi:hypothetical protein
MIFALAEEGTLFVKADLSEAQRDFNALDVESEVFRFFNEDGRSLEPVFIRPNRKRRILGLFSKWDWYLRTSPRFCSPRDPIDIALAKLAERRPIAGLHPLRPCASTSRNVERSGTLADSILNSRLYFIRKDL